MSLGDEFPDGPRSTACLHGESYVAARIAYEDT